MEFEQVDTRTLHVRFLCPWCGNSASVPASQKVRGANSEFSVLVVCQHTRCRRPAIVIGTEINLLDHVSLRPEAIFPNPQPKYAEAGVPADIARDFQECLHCNAAGFFFAAAVVGRRVLQSALVDRGAKKYILVDQINELSDDILPKLLKQAAQHVRLIGNDAAHANQVDRTDLEKLVNFVALVLNQLYVLPYELEQAAQVRPIPAKHMPATAATAPAVTASKKTKE